LKSHTLRPDTWTSADAAGLPILPGLVRYEEVATGEVRHAIRFTAPQTRRAYVWPGRHFASSLTAAGYPPMGQRFRLKAGVDITGFSPEVQVILRALKKYGMILADNGSSWFLSGAPDERWNNEHLHEFHRLHGSDFEAVDATTLMADRDSGQARLAGTGAAVVNAASYSTGPVSPGEIVSIFGDRIGPESPLGLQLLPDGTVSRQLGEVVVQFEGTPAPLLYASATQINAVIPYAARGASTKVQVMRGAAVVFDATLPVTEAAPGIFAITDERFLLNSLENPAAPGSTLVIFGTGEGETVPAGVDGMVAGSGLPSPRLLVKVFVGEQEARVVYAGAAPGLVAGVVQVNFELPAGLGPGGRPVRMRVGQWDSDAVSIAVGVK
jgi:uncharacterized protein (TIGR03437 family)